MFPDKHSAKFMVDNCENRVAPAENDSASAGHVHDRCQKKQLLRYEVTEKGEIEEVCDFVND
jgi:hypothetical protein